MKIYPLNDSRSTDPFHYLTVSIAWKNAGDEEQATAWRMRAKELFATGRAEHVKIARMLGSNDPVTLAELNDLAISAKTKAILLVALAQRSPNQSAELLKTARILSVDRSYPHHLIQRLSEAPQ